MPIAQLPKGEFKTSVVLENVHYGDNGHAMVWAETIYNKSGAGNGPRIEVAWAPSRAVAARDSFLDLILVAAHLP